MSVDVKLSGILHPHCRRSIEDRSVGVRANQSVVSSRSSPDLESERCSTGADLRGGDPIACSVKRLYKGFCPSPTSWRPFYDRLSGEVVLLARAERW